MKKAMMPAVVFAICLISFITASSFTSHVITKERVGTIAALSNKTPVTFLTSTTSADGTTYYGTVVATGGINASGTYVMPTEAHGMALHCILMITFPDGTLTIRMNCNMRTLNGRWQVLEGTGAYAEVKGNGPLVMPNETDEILTGTLRW